ncbi:MAG: xanthine dehydrogenase molybdopterin binding subunit [Microvirga sp.]
MNKPIAPIASAPLIGAALPHESAIGHVTGAARYVDDLWPDVAHVTHAWPVQAPHAHARVVRIDADAARKAPGVLAVLTADDVPGENDTGPARHDEPLFPSEVCFAGQAVAWVIAETEEAARLGAAAVRVDYEVLPAILSIEDAIAAGSFLTDGDRLHRGDAEAALRDAPHRLAGELRIGGQEHFYLETNAALAYRDHDGGLMVHSSTQHPSETQEIVARVLGLPKHAVVVQCLRMGGAFGGKEVQANAWAAVAALAATTIGRPVRVRLTRRQDMVLTGKRHPFLARFRVGFEGDGALRAVAIELFSDGGWSLDLSFPVLGRAMFHADNCYHVPHMDVVGRVCRTHHVSNTAFRGFGGPQGMLAIEHVMDQIAWATGRDPLDVRYANFYRPGENHTPYGMEVEETDTLLNLVRTLEQTSNYRARRQEITAFNASSPIMKRGLALTPVKFGISFTLTHMNQAGALVHVYQDGSVHLNHGGTEMGQGLYIKVAQVVAEEFGIAMERVRITATTTAKVPNTSPTAASSGSDLNGMAARIAAGAIKKRMMAYAAEAYGIPEDQIGFRDDRVFIGNQSLSFDELAKKCIAARVQLSEAGHYKTPKITWNREKGTGRPFFYFAYGAACSEVIVDTLTGENRLVRTDILHDVGRSLNPAIDIGQIEGGFVQGMGWLTTEELVFGKEGHLLTHAPSTYKIPVASDVPADFNVALYPNENREETIYRSKAVGEPPIMLANSVFCALADAIHTLDPSKPAPLNAPATPEAILRACESLRGRPMG